MSKVCFVTTGATAEFSELIAAVLDPQCLQLLKKEGFTTLNIQCGETFKNVESMKPADTQGLAIHAFDFKPDLHRDMRECQALEGPGCSRKQGLIILHAGAGTVMDAMRLGLNMIVVPNPSLLDNHQDELAEELHMQNYATAASVQ
ncbi:glycosyl transferase [Mollisia scopiformis]|uniref:UDP-N-acetylglucosamine transferase subunit ALG13 n=1 Tax=Mollisia scopiformis TaxID=149040 RepID=A0A194X602_MOLSC|nr:glycosyl transferase [Mollisia scopiformis]KUJ15615.1 glycosyl transferase [Mollisia scopiformis]